MNDDWIEIAFPPRARIFLQLIAKVFARVGIDAVTDRVAGTPFGRRCRRRRTERQSHLKTSPGQAGRLADVSWNNPQLPFTTAKSGSEVVLKAEMARHAGERANIKFFASLEVG